MFIFSELLFGAFLPIIATISYATLGSFVSLAVSTLIAAVFFGALITYRRHWKEMQDRTFIAYSFGTGMFVSVLFFGFFFWGLKYTTPGNAAIIILFQVFTSYVFFRWYRREVVPFSHIIGSVLMVIGALIILAPGFKGFNVGDVLVLLGTFATPMGNYFQQEARKLGSSESLLFLRSMFALPFLFFLALLIDAHPSWTDLSTSLPYLLINGFLLLGFAKLLWVEGIHRIPVTKAIAITSIGPLFTLFFAWLLLHQVPTVWQLTSLAPLILGVLLLTDHVKFPQRF